MNEPFDKLPRPFTWAVALPNPQNRLLEDEIPDALPGKAKEQDKDPRHDETGLGATAPITGDFFAWCEFQAVGLKFTPQIKLPSPELRGRGQGRGLFYSLF
jgi:hypothetical protein